MTISVNGELGQRLIRVLAVDDLDANLLLVRRLLAPPEFEVSTASRPEDALKALTATQPDVLLLDVRMPGHDGFAMCRELKADPAKRFVPIILVTATSDPTDRLRAIEAGADDFVSKPLNPLELKARVRALARMKRYTDELDSAEEVILTLAATIEARDAYTEGHCQRLASYGRSLGAALGLADGDLRALELGGYLHDVGKIGIPDSVLLKEGPLTAREFEIMKTHTTIGDRLLGSLRSLAAVRPIVRSHHERLDGSGYPDGLAGTKLPLLAEIVGLVDVYDALSSRRPYRGPLGHDQIVHALRDEARRGWRRADLTELWLELSTQPGHAPGQRTEDTHLIV